MYKNMTKDLTFFDPVCGRPGFHIDDVPKHSTPLNTDRMEVATGPAAYHENPLICAGCGRYLMGDEKDAQRLANPLNYHVRAGLSAGRLRTATLRLQTWLYLAQQEPRREAIGLPLQLIQDAEQGVDAFNLQPFPQPCAVHDKAGQPGIQEYMGVTLVTVDGMPEGLMMLTAELHAASAPPLADDLLAIVANLQQQLADCQAAVASAERFAATRYDGMMNWKRTAEDKDRQLIDLQKQLNSARDVLRTEMQRGNERTMLAIDARDKLQQLRELIQDDDVAASFKTLAQYRAFLLNEPAVAAAKAE